MYRVGSTITWDRSVSVSPHHCLRQKCIGLAAPLQGTEVYRVGSTITYYRSVSGWSHAHTITWSRSVSGWTHHYMGPKCIELASPCIDRIVSDWPRHYLGPTFIMMAAPLHKTEVYRSTEVYGTGSTNLITWDLRVSAAEPTPLHGTEVYWPAATIP